jgi:hypothetical protein
MECFWMYFLVFSCILNACNCTVKICFSQYPRRVTKPFLYKGNSFNAPSTISVTILYNVLTEYGERLTILYALALTKCAGVVVQWHVSIYCYMHLMLTCHWYSLHAWLKLIWYTVMVSSCYKELYSTTHAPTPQNTVMFVRKARFEWPCICYNIHI